MNPIKVFGYRTLQFLMNKVFMSFLKFREPTLIRDAASFVKAADVLKEKGYKKSLIIIGPTIKKLGMINPLLERLEQFNIGYVEFSDVEPNPTFNSIIPAVDLAKKEGIDSIIAIGGGSNLDCAKIIGACLANDTTDVKSLKGVLKVKKEIPFLIAIPTTAGTGSEVTVAAVIIDPATKDKYAISDPKLIPQYAILDETLLTSLPQKIIAYTGMDALTHAVEAYIGSATTKKTRKAALDSINIIYHNLLGFYQDPHNLAASKNMLYASFLAGVAFTRSYVGYVHSLAHQIGGKYNVQHGLANAVLLPYVLEAYGKKAHKKLGEIAKMLGLCHPETPNDKAAAHFIQWIKIMRVQLGIPNTLPGAIKAEDLDELANHAEKEANPLYPVPRIMNKEELKNIYSKIDPELKGGKE